MKDSTAQTHNIAGALAVIGELLPLIEQAENRFKSARFWGFIDIFGGGFITDIIKHVKLGSAAETMNRIQFLLQQLQQKLSFINIPTDYSMHSGGFLTFADFLFDGILVDVYMQSKIISGLEQIRQLRQKLEYIKSTLSKN